MKKYRYYCQFETVGFEIYAVTFTQAYYLAMAKAINDGIDHYSFKTITDEHGSWYEANNDVQVFKGRKQ